MSANDSHPGKCLGCGDNDVGDQTKELCSRCSVREQGEMCLKCRNNKMVDSYLVCAECLHKYWEVYETQTILCGGCGRVPVKDKKNASPLCLACEKTFEDNKRRKCARCGKEGEFNDCYFCSVCVEGLKREIGMIIEGEVFRMSPPPLVVSPPTPTPPVTNPTPTPPPPPLFSIPGVDMTLVSPAFQDVVKGAYSYLLDVFGCFTECQIGQHEIDREFLESIGQLVRANLTVGVDYFSIKVREILCNFIVTLFRRDFESFYVVCRGNSCGYQQFFRDSVERIETFRQPFYCQDLKRFMNELSDFENRSCLKLFNDILVPLINNRYKVFSCLLNEYPGRDQFKTIWVEFDRDCEFYCSDSNGWRKLKTPGVFDQFLGTCDSYLAELRGLIEQCRPSPNNPGYVESEGDTF